MEHGSSPEEVLDSIIILRKDQVMKEGAVDDESVGAGIRDFLTTNAMVKEKVVVEVNNSIILHDVQEEQSDLTKVPSSAFEKVSHEPVAGPSWRI